MEERLYATHADVYDALYRELKDYGSEVEFVLDRFEERRRTDGRRALVLGCGPGEHAKRLVSRGFDVVGVDKYEAMLEVAREKSTATFRVGSLPDVGVEGRFDLVWLPFTVINHLDPEDLEPTLLTFDDLLADGGVAVFDNGAFPAPDGELQPPGLAVHATDLGDVARLTQVRPLDDRRVRWHSVVFVGDRGEFFLDAHDLTVFEDEEIASSLEALGYEFDTHDGYGTGGSSTVFVAR